MTEWDEFMAMKERNDAAYAAPAAGIAVPPKSKDVEVTFVIEFRDRDGWWQYLDGNPDTLEDAQAALERYATRQPAGIRSYRLVRVTTTTEQIGEVLPVREPEWGTKAIQQTGLHVGDDFVSLGDLWELCEQDALTTEVAGPGAVIHVPYKAGKVLEQLGYLAQRTGGSYYGTDKLRALLKEKTGEEPEVP